MVDWTKVFELYKDEHLYQNYGDGSTELVIAVILCILTVSAVLLWSAIMAGLTVGLMSIDEFRLALVKETGTEKEKKQVENVEYLLEDRHYLLVVILASNCAAMEALPLLMDRLMPKAAVVPVSVTFLLIFGEVIPQAVCLSDPLKYGSFFSTLLWVLSWLLYIFAKPITILLEYCVEDPDGNVLFTRKEMHAVIDMHAASQSITVPEVNPLAIELGALNLSGEKEPGKLQLSPKRRSPRKSPSPNEVVILDHDTATIMKGALKMKSKTVSCAYTPLSKVFMLAQDQVLDDDTISKLIDRGHSRIPVYAESKTHVVGIFLVKRLIGVNMHDPETAYKVGDFVDGLPLVFPSNLPLLEALNLFQTGHSHLAIVTNFPHEVIRSMKLEQPLSKDVSLKGIITLEDVIEELIQEEIEDEADREVQMLTFSYSRQLCDMKPYKAPIPEANSFSDYDSLKELALSCKTSPRLNEMAWKSSPKLNTLTSTDFQL